MIQIWRPVTAGNYRVKRGDVIALFGADPQDVYTGQSEGGYVVSQAAGCRLKDIWSDYEPEDEACCWTRKRDEGIKVRLLPNKAFSNPLPLP